MLGRPEIPTTRSVRRAGPLRDPSACVHACVRACRAVRAVRACHVCRAVCACMRAWCRVVRACEPCMRLASACTYGTHSLHALTARTNALTYCKCAVSARAHVCVNACVRPCVSPLAYVCGCVHMPHPHMCLPSPTCWRASERARARALSVFVRACVRMRMGSNQIYLWAGAPPSDLLLNFNRYHSPCGVLH